MGHELVYHLKPTLPEVDTGLNALICISAAPPACLSLTSAVLEAAATPVGPPTAFIFKLPFYSEKDPPSAPLQWIVAY